MRASKQTAEENVFCAVLCYVILLFIPFYIFFFPISFSFRHVFDFLFIEQNKREFVSFFMCVTRPKTSQQEQMR